MYKKFMAFLLAVMMMASMAACGNGSTDNGGNKSADNGSTEPEQTEAVKAETPRHYKSYELVNNSKDGIYINIWYREGSNEVARIDGAMYVPSTNASYEDLKADGSKYAEQVEAANVSREIMYLDFSEVKTSEPYLSIAFYFGELDGSNSGSVPLAADFVGLPMTNGKLLVDKCDEYILSLGMTLTDED